MNNRVIVLLPSTGAFGKTYVANSANVQGLYTFVIADTTAGPTEWAIGVSPFIAGEVVALERGFVSSTQADDRMRKLANKLF